MNAVQWRGRVTGLSWLIAFALGCPPSSSANVPPVALMGAFVDDYGIRYEIDADVWSQGDARYHIQVWNADQQFLVARNDSLNVADGGLWTRIDWVFLDGPEDFAWAYCYTVYQAGSPEEASAGPPAQRETPRTGCNGFPFSRMRRLAQ